MNLPIIGRIFQGGFSRFIDHALPPVRHFLRISPPKVNSRPDDLAAFTHHHHDPTRTKTTAQFAREPRYFRCLVDPDRPPGSCRMQGAQITDQLTRGSMNHGQPRIIPHRLVPSIQLSICLARQIGHLVVPNGVNLMPTLATFHLTTDSGGRLPEVFLHPHCHSFCRES